jgi:hypothetical protein
MLLGEMTYICRVIPRIKSCNSGPSIDSISAQKIKTLKNITTLFFLAGDSYSQILVFLLGF